MGNLGHLRTMRLLSFAAAADKAHLTLNTATVLEHRWQGVREPGLPLRARWPYIQAVRDWGSAGAGNI